MLLRIQLKQRTVLLRKLKEVLRRFDSPPVGRVVQPINPILRGWVNYFAIGNASRCFGFIKDWVEKKVRRHLMRARNQRGYGWKRWCLQR
jgi:RNA-directed DNA polymerase